MDTHESFYIDTSSSNDTSITEVRPLTRKRIKSNSVVRCFVESNETSLEESIDLQEMTLEDFVITTRDVTPEVELIQEIMSKETKLPIIYTNSNFSNLFSKGLNHDDNGFVNKDNIKRLIQGILEHDITLLNSVIVKTLLVGISNIIRDETLPIELYNYIESPTLDSNIITCDMCELYCMSLVRDVPFVNFYSNFTVDRCCTYLNSLLDYCMYNSRVTAYNIFRGATYANLQGPYISQFLYNRKYDVIIENDYMYTWEQTISVQNGDMMSTLTRKESRYITTGRDLASIKDSYKIFKEVYKWLILSNIPFNEAFLDISKKISIEDFSTFSDVKYLLTLMNWSVTNVCYYIKWHNIFLTPEELGINIERIYRTRENSCLVSLELLRNNVMDAIRTKNNTMLLTQVNPSGSSNCPSRSSIKAAVASACATVLKFFFNLNKVITTFEPTKNGTELINTHKKVILEDELTKLVFNLGASDKWSGTTYNNDVLEGIELGEKIALFHLSKFIFRYPYKLIINITKFDGNTINITNM